MIKLIRTSSDNIDFKSLVVLLDKDLAMRDGEEHNYFAQFNKTDNIKEVIVAYWNEEAVGCGAIKAFTAPTTAEVKRMFVRPENRGQRIAANILKELEIWAKELNYTACVLETGYKQPEAIRLYQREGYKQIPNYEQYIGIESSICMRKEL